MPEPLLIRRARWFELPIVFLTLAAIYLALMAGTRTFDLLSHPLWLDEVLTSTLANDPSFAHMISAIKGGVETNPPLLYLILWPIAHFAKRPLTNLELRVFSMAFMLIALVGIYALCRRRFTKTASAIAVLAIAIHPLVLNLAVEARFYAPWLALTILYCLALARYDEKPKIFGQLLLIILAILIATIHWFGIAGLALITVGEFLAHRRFKRLVPFSIAVAAVLACIPFYLGQRAGLSVKTWVSPVNASDLRDELIALFGAPSFLFVGIATALCAMIFRARSIVIEPVTSEIDAPIRQDEVDSGTQPRNVSAAADHLTIGFAPAQTSFLPIISLIAIPFVILTFSILVQPAFVARYLVLAIAPLALIVAMWSNTLNGRAAVMVFFGLLALGGAETIARSHAARGLDAGFNDAVSLIETKTNPDDLIVFKRRREMYPVLHLRPAWEGRVKQLDFGDNNASLLITPMSKYERDIGRKVVTHYPQFGLIDLTALKQRSKPFYVIVPEDQGELEEVRIELEGFTITRVQGALYQVMPPAISATSPTPGGIK